MASMRQIRSRIKVAKNIQQITKAMKMVASARLKRAQDRVHAARPYSEKIGEVMKSLSRAGGSMQHPLLEVREPVRVGVLLISADRGLCGSYSTNIIKKAMEVVRPLEPSHVRMMIVGRKGQAFFRRRPYPVAAEYPINMISTSFVEAKEIAAHTREMFVAGEIDLLYLVYTKFRSALVQRPMVIQLLPLTTEDSAAEDAPVTAEDYIFEPDAASILSRLLPQYVDTLIYQALVDAVASEYGAKMTAMSSATDNAGKMISSLTLVLNRARQATITKEIAEIVGGAEALK